VRFYFFFEHFLAPPLAYQHPPRHQFSLQTYNQNKMEDIKRKDMTKGYDQKNQEL